MKARKRRIRASGGGKNGYMGDISDKEERGSLYEESGIIRQNYGCLIVRLPKKQKIIDLSRKIVYDG